MSHPPTTALLDHRDRLAMRTIAVLSGAMGLALAAGQITYAVRYLTSRDVTLNLLAERDLAVQPHAGVAAAAITRVDVTSDALAMTTRGLYAASALLLALTALLVAAAVVGLLLSAARDRAFRPLLSRFAMVSGCVLVLGPLLSTGLSGLGAMKPRASWARPWTAS